MSAEENKRLTTRERRERKAERLRRWAEGREAKSAAAFERSSELGEMIPFGQPIIVGHYSERGHRAHLAKIGAAMDQSCEHAAKARDMLSRADGIEAQNKRAIFSDDPDAVEQLTAKIARLEAQRETMKVRNAAFRKEHRADLKELTPFHRDRAMPFQRYELTNLSANISRLRKRLDQVQRPPVDRIISARFDSSCASCGAELKRGDQIRYSKQAGARCVECES